MSGRIEYRDLISGERSLRVLPGQYYDVETGKHYNYFRDYDATIGRYLQSDPVGVDGGLNTYAYVVGNPLTQIDLWGLANSGPYPRPNGAATGACSYYDQKCQSAPSGCRNYYCYLASTVCRSPNVVPTLWPAKKKGVDCVRNCLIDEDKKEWDRKSQCGNRCPPRDNIDTYHCKCYQQCGLSSFNYPGVGASFPCWGTW